VSLALPSHVRGFLWYRVAPRSFRLASGAADAPKRRPRCRVDRRRAAMAVAVLRPCPSRFFGPVDRCTEGWGVYWCRSQRLRPRRQRAVHHTATGVVVRGGRGQVTPGSTVYGCGPGQAE
jgi:hypothetical protein